MENGKIIVPVGRLPWVHEMRVANALAMMGYTVEFLPERSIKTADILLDGIEFEMKSPRSGNANSLEHILKKALKQSSNIIVDTFRIKDKNDDSITKFLIKQARIRRCIKRLILVTRHGRVIDIMSLI